MIDTQTLSIVLTGIGMIIALTYYALQIRNQNRTRQTQLFMNLYNQYRSKDFVRDTRELSSWQWKDFDDFRAKYGSRADKEANTLFISTANFFDGVGVLVENNELDPMLVEKLMSEWIIWFWEKFGDVIMEYRKVSNPQYLESVEFLYNKIKPLTAQ